MALLIALAAGWATGQIGLSLTMGAFLGGMTLAETPYRAVIQSEIAPFRGLLLGFFFISVGRTLADALNEFGIGYSAVERDQRRLSEAVADGYAAVFGDMADPRLWNPIAVHGRKISALTAPSYEMSSELTPMARQLYPSLLHYAAVADGAEAERFHALGIRAVVDRSFPPGLDLAAAVLGTLGIDADALTGWMRRQQRRALGGAEESVVAA